VESVVPPAEGAMMLSIMPVTAECTKKQLGEDDHAERLPVCNLFDSKKFRHQEVPQPLYEKSENQGEQYGKDQPNENHPDNSQDLSGSAI
jgi:hypothetical protein